MIADFFAMLVRLATGVRARAIPDWTGKPCVFFANHGSHLDPLVIWAALPHDIRRSTSPVAAMDYWTKTALRRWLANSVFQAVLLQRKGRPTDRSHPLQAIFDVLETGRSLIIFPEGTRSPDGTLKSFKPGLFHLRERFPNLVLIPVSLQNLNRILPKGQWLPVPMIGRMTIHPPLQTSPSEGKEDFLHKARQAVASGLQPNQCHE